MRLPGLLHSPEQRNPQAMDGQFAYAEFLSMLHDEVADRDHLSARLKQLASVPVLIVNDFLLKPLRPPRDEGFHDLITERVRVRCDDPDQ